MKKLIVGAGAAAAAAACMALFGTGVAAAAPDVVGQTYADASSAIDEAGSTAIVASTVGGRLPQDECIVTNAWDAPFVRDMDFAGEFGHADSEVMLALNCNGDHATATNAGPSLGSPEGREAKAAADQAAAEEQQSLEEVSTPDE